MIEIDPVVSALSGKLPEGLTFQPSDVNLREYFVSKEKGEAEEGDEAIVREEWWSETECKPLTPTYPTETTVVAIDSTSFTLGYIPDGLVGVVRASIVIKPAGQNRHKLERYGPYLVPITDQEKDVLYRNLYKTVYGESTKSVAPDLSKTLERTRNLIERHIEFQVARTYRDSLILLDGSLIGGTVANPRFFLKKIIDHAAGNKNLIAAISKSTRLTLQHSRRNILSLLEGISGPCYVEGVKHHISQEQDKYLGDIYVARLTPRGEPFRIDLPENAPAPHKEMLNAISGLAGDYGYPEELKLAHMTCVLSAIEILELQAAAITLHGLIMKEEIRPKIFPL